MPAFRAARDGGNQQDFVAVLESVLSASQKADVFVIHINVEKAVRRSVGRAKGIADAGEFRFEPRKEISQITRGELRCVSASCKLSERRRDADGDGHKASPVKEEN